jgi:hypothetical protein
MRIFLELPPKLNGESAPSYRAHLNSPDGEVIATSKTPVPTVNQIRTYWGLVFYDQHHWPFGVNTWHNIPR